MYVAPSAGVVSVIVGGVVSVIGRTLPRAFPNDSVNQRLWSGPDAMPKGALVALGTGNSAKVPSGVI